MSKEYTTKKERERLHKLVVLHQLMMETLDDINSEPKFKDGHKEAFAPALKFSETFLDSVFDKEDVKATMYIDGMTEKIDTVIRKNYKPH
jgi:hypothetical protein